MDVHLIQPGQTMDIAGENIIFFNQDHGFIPSLGLRMGDIAYSTDVVRLDDAALAALAGIKIWVVDCFTAGPPHPTHANIDQVLAWAAKLKPTRVILTHMGPDMDYASLCANLPPGIEPGFDGMIIEAA
ncbi:MAG: hypothetical protein B7X01_04520 [Acidiphilium sp. 21-62-4]|nr:MAG: hypothetical protein B7X01_04520 [Acidiphilium sp. 21-62-4]